MPTTAIVRSTTLLVIVASCVLLSYTCGSTHATEGEMIVTAGDHLPSGIVLGKVIVRLGGVDKVNETITGLEVSGTLGAPRYFAGVDIATSSITLGDIVVIGSKVLRLHSISGGVAETGSATFVPCDNDKLHKRISNDGASICIPLGATVRIEPYTYSVSLEAADMADKTQRICFTIDRVDRKRRWNNELLFEKIGAMREQLVKPGDVVNISAESFVVRDVVLPDKNARVCGWIELIPRPVASER